MKSIKELSTNEYVYSVIAKISMITTGMVFSVLIARYVGAEMKGTLAYIQSIVSIGSIVLTFGLHQAYPYYRREFNSDAFVSIFMSIVIALFMIQGVFSIVIAALVVTSKEMIVITMLTPLWGYTRVTGYVMLVETPNKRNKALAMFSLAGTLYVLVLFLFTKSNFVLAITALSFVEICKAAYFTFNIEYTIDFRSVRWNKVKELGTYGFFPMIALLMTMLNYRIDVIMLRNSMHVTLAEVGVYSIGFALAEKALLIPDAVRDILLSRMAKGKGEAEVAKVMRICFPVSILAAIAISIFSKIFIDIMYGSEFEGAYSVTVISVLGTIFLVFFKMISQYNIISKKQSLNVLMLMLAILINVVFNIVLVPRYGINGAAVATVIGNLACALTFIVYFSKISGLHIKNLVFLNRNDVELLRKGLRIPGHSKRRRAL